MSTTTYQHFYATAYRADHRHPGNLALHIFGTLAGLALLAVAAAALIAPWWALAFPFVHALPGLIGHRLFDRDEVVGDLRITRSDYPLWWFIRANHRMTWDVLTGRWQQR
jgi:Protein of unknown function (DUF962)